MDFKMMIGKKLREAREEMGLEQKDIAQELGIGESAYGHIESGRSSIKAEYLIQLPKIFNKPLSWFVGENVELTNLTTNEQYLLELYRALPDEGPFRDQAIQLLSTWLDASLKWLESEYRRLDDDG